MKIFFDHEKLGGLEAGGGLAGVSRHDSSENPRSGLLNLAWLSDPSDQHQVVREGNAAHLRGAVRVQAAGTPHLQLSERDQFAFFGSLICTGAGIR